MLAAFLCAGTATAQELTLLAGGMNSPGIEHKSYAWGLDYRHGLSEHLAFSLSWLNEGHIPNHHRDGQAIQLWARSNLLDRRLSLAAGVGPYRYYDTTRSSDNVDFTNVHGWGGVVSAAATWYGESGWIYELRANRIVARNDVDSNSLMLGIGYQLEKPPVRGSYATGAHQTEKTTGSEVTAFVGRTIVNSFHSEQGAASAVEYRRGISPLFEWTVGFLNEGDARLIRRNGVIAQLWFAHEFFDDRLALAAGVGPYIALDHHTIPGQSDATVSAMVTASAAWRFDRRFFLRGSWNRVATHYDRDTDVLLLGLGMRF